MKALKEKYVVTSDGKKTDVILSFKQYKQLIEDLHDLGKVAERRDEKNISLEEMKRKLKQDGLL